MLSPLYVDLEYDGDAQYVPAILEGLKPFLAVYESHRLCLQPCLRGKGASWLISIRRDDVE